MRSSFSGYYVAKQGINVSRAQLEVTGQNISNVNTEGYTKQRVDTYALGSMMGKSRVAAAKSDYIGSGVNINKYSQSRDAFLDVRYRQENAKYGGTSAELSVLTEIGYVLDDAVVDGLNDQIQDFVSQLQNLSGKANDPVIQNVVKGSAQSVAQLLNQYATQIKNAKNEMVTTVSDGAIREINGYLQNIATLNKAIRSANVSGDPALELNDQRNTLIDNLSTYFDIKLSTREVDVGGVMVEELCVNMKTSNGDSFQLVDNDNFAQFNSYIKDDKIEIQLLDFDGKPVYYSANGSLTAHNGEVTDFLSKGAIRGYINRIDSAGPFDEPQSQTMGIAYYEKALDCFAATFAKVLNEANSTADEDKPMFESSVAGEPITASNICVSTKWSNAEGSYITPTKVEPQDGLTNDTDNSNILYMISLFEGKHEFKRDDGVTVYTGKLYDYCTDMSTQLGMDIQNITKEQGIYEEGLDDIVTSRMSVTGVNIDEETIDMMMYSRAFSASSRFMTSIDEIIQTIIDKMGLAGR